MLVCRLLVSSLMTSSVLLLQDIQLLVKHLEPQYENTAVGAVPLSDPACTALEGKTKTQVVIYIKETYDDEWVSQHASTD